MQSAAVRVQSPLAAARRCAYLRHAIDDTDADHAAVPFDSTVVRRVAALLEALGDTAACEAALAALQPLEVLELVACVLCLDCPPLQARVSARLSAILAAHADPASVRAAFNVAADLTPAEEGDLGRRRPHQSTEGVWGRDPPPRLIYV